MKAVVQSTPSDSAPASSASTSVFLPEIETEKHDACFILATKLHFHFDFNAISANGIFSTNLSSDHIGK